ncbi:bifunctional diaminohydroxyphosphoribosylaminopyrimidine deaminase/5-amino-6-(5-phosphoribosylamino)uracil reductase RibD [Aequorivita echinoideorum]|uniref:Riboflavin biosynthesis protein RibD n=1 Tax=Aequorivita echinoideorum TaxID=1549647 RepID=A0ABS5S5T8_9FLAO|nr:bifunctional diaminohydroxyphosphoribosylaminopyrimidine deaminase/5-amino-6-(5-phosphoribosylamino)uracil reductase RibD [Aequorivita echinoideorum]MBT0608588.1 bifunctional diaminohydroxyphosphoribosylaminopyrimidine deaminase/5-amino-6-(5-phosphoribosylamino)uracil reductase RibD [Aequorivita echinoideorum]
MKIHEKYMARCIQLAKNGLGTTYPNPLVGSVIINQNKIIGEGWHFKSGLPHAEVNAIASVKDPGLLKQATIYVSLEPCSHFGKTPPCADLIIEKGIRNVVIGSTDPNPQVAGRGIKKLIDAGCEVIVGVLEKECNELNKRFFTFHQQKRPYIFLKWAETADGFIAPKNENRKEKKPVWITNEFSRQLAHKLRSEEMSILVGTSTVMQDNPSLTVRHWQGENPVRIIIDKNLKIPENYSVLDGSVQTLVFSENNHPKKENIEFIEIDFSENIAKQICNVLHKRKIQSLIVEGGAKILQTFIDAGLWDEALIFKSNISFSEGVTAPTFSGYLVSEKIIKDDRLQTFKKEKF